MKTAIIYISIHHGNTKKVVDEMAEVLDADLFDLTKQKVNIAEYDVIGLASGCFYRNMHERIIKFAAETDFLKKQRVFLVCTCGIAYRDYTKSTKRILNKKGVDVIGSFQCRDFDTFGPFEKIGGVAKGHPNEKDLSEARAWIELKIQAHKKSV